MTNLGTPFSNLPACTSLNGSEIFPCDQGGTTKTATLNLMGGSAFSNQFPATIEYVVDGGGQTVSGGTQGYLEVPFSATINQVTLLADRIGSITVDIWKCTESQFDAGATFPTSANSITGTATPAIAAGTKYQDATLAGWTVALSSGDILAFNIAGVTSIQRITTSLKVSRAVVSSL